MKFYKCKHCGNIIIKIEDKNVPVFCCGEPLEELVPGQIEAAQEKHVPSLDIQNEVITVSVGEIEHPMTEEHSIRWICLELENGFMIQYLKENESPQATFYTSQNIKSIYSYCNLHGLWEVRVTGDH